MATQLAAAMLAALTLAVPAPQAAPAAWAVSGATPAGQPIAVGDVAVGHVTRGDRHWVRGIAPATGRTLWESEAAGEQGPVRVGGRAVFLQPEPDFGPNYASLVVVDPADGSPVHRSPAMLFGTAPESCFGERAVCVTATPVPEEPLHGYRLNLENGAYIPFDVPVGARALGHGLVELGDRIGQVRDGAVRWEWPLTSAFPAGFGIDDGTPWELSSGVHLGSAYGPGARAATALTRNLAVDTASAGLAAIDGRVLWSERGTSIGCGGRIGLPGHAVRCRYRGEETMAYATSTAKHRGLDVTVEGFDPRTGRTRWRVPLGAEPALAGGGRGVAVAGPRTVLAGEALLDLGTGAVTRPAPGSVFWCPRPSPVPGQFSRGASRPVASPCRADGSPVTGTPPAEASAAIGAVAGGHAVVATPDGFRGVPLARPAG